MSPNVEPVRFRLRVSHAQFADYSQLYRLLVAPFARKRSRKYLFIGLAGGAVIGGLLVLVVAYWKLWGTVTLTIGMGFDDDPIVLEGLPLWACALAVFLVGFLAAWLDRVSVSKGTLRSMYDASRREPSNWTLLIGEAGIQTDMRGVIAVFPWDSTSNFRQGATASFLFFNRGLNGLVIPNKAFADSAERAACLAFIQSKVAKQ